MSICCCGRCLCALIFFGGWEPFILYFGVVALLVFQVCVDLIFFENYWRYFFILVEIKTLWLGVPAVQFFCCFETPLDFMDVGLGIVHMDL